MIGDKKVGLSLSGGGYRAAVYHLGTLKKLKELDILDKVDIISTISGGSIIGAYYGLHGKDFEKFENGILKLPRRNIIDDILLSSRFLIICLLIIMIFFVIISLLFTNYAWISSIVLVLVFLIILKYQFKIFPVSKIINSIYNNFFFHNKTLNDFNDYPVIAINATNMETGRPFTFSKRKMSDSTYEFPIDKSKSIKFLQKDFPISLAVASSTCVPFAFTPIYIDKIYFENESDFDSIKPCLVDGGVYDNQGIHKLTQKNSSYECDVVIVSDAGSIFPRLNTFNNVIELLIHTSDIFMNRIKNYQMIQHVFDNYKFNKKLIAYQSLGWDPASCISSFIDNLKKGNVLESAILTHGISAEDIKCNRWDEIQTKIEYQIGYSQIINSMPNEREIAVARNVKTNLKTLSDEQTRCLIKQAQSLTEIQVRLYCPQLIK